MPTDTNNKPAGNQPLHSGATLPATPPPRPALAGLAIFLDLDGTLAPIAQTPDEAHVPAATLHLLDDLCRANAGSLAIVSGRDTPDIDRLLGPLLLPYAALHGARIRLPDGKTETLAVPQESLRDICITAENRMRSLPGTILERKTLSVALHYRNAPGFEPEIRQLAAEVLLKHGAIFEIQDGKMVVEIKPRGASKALAIERFMGMLPFQGRIPLYVGDDLTDESAFRIVNSLNGISIKIGEGRTQACWRLDDPPALVAWLSSLLADHVYGNHTAPIDGRHSHE